MTDRPPALEIDDLSVTYSRWGQEVVALADVTLSVAPGEWILLTGHNGAGKSTLLKAVAGLQLYQRGKVRIAGEDLARLSPSRRSRQLFMIHQNPMFGVANLLTVAENLRVADLSPGRDDAERRELLQELGLGARSKQPANLLSGGERQLVALAMVSLRRPTLLLLDEPFAALDHDKTGLAVSLLRTLHAEGCTLLQVVHDASSVRGDATRILTLDRGHLSVGEFGVASATTRVEV